MAPMAHPPTPPGTMRPRKTLDDYLALPDDVRAELLDGELYVTPAPGTPHQRMVGALFRRLADEVERLAAGEVFVAPCDVHLPTGDVVQPDVFVVLAGQADVVHEDGIHGTPALVIEVLSPVHPERDRIVKRWRYAAAGVAEYWIVDPALRSVEVFRLQGADEAAQLSPAGWFTGQAAVASGLLPELDLPLEAIFRS